MQNSYLMEHCFSPCKLNGLDCTWAKEVPGGSVIGPSSFRFSDLQFKLQSFNLNGSLCKGCISNLSFSNKEDLSPLI